MSLSDKQKKRIEKLAKFVEDKDFAIVEEFVSLDEKIDSIKESTENSLSQINETLKKKSEEELSFEIDPESIRGLPGEDGEDGKDYVLTDKDKKEIAESIELPIVEKVIEKTTEIIREQPIVTNEVREVAVYESPNAIVEKLETLRGTDRLNKDAIDGIEDLVTEEDLNKLKKLLLKKTGNVTVGGGLSSATADETYIRQDGTTPLTADWDAGSFEIRAQTFESDVVTGTAPFVVASTTKVTNLNADTVDGFSLDQDVLTSSSPTFSTLNLSATSNQIVLQSGGVTTTITESGATSNKTITLPNATGTVALLSGTQTFTGATTLSSTLTATGTNGIIINSASPTLSLTESGGLVNWKIYSSSSVLVIEELVNGGAPMVFDYPMGTITLGDAAGFNGILNLDANNNIDLQIAGTTEVSVTDNTMTFNAGAVDPILNWGTSGELQLRDAIFSVEAGTSAAQARVGGTLDVNTTTVGNVGTGEDDLSSFSVAANSLAVNGDSIYFEASGTIASNVNAKRIKVKFGATTIFDTGAAGIPVSAAIDWTIEGRIIRTGAATQKCYVTMNTNNATLASYADYATAAETLSGAVTLKLTGEAVSNNDIVEETLLVGWDPNA